VRAAAEWARDIIHDPEEPGHLAILDALERSSSSRSAVAVADILAREAAKNEPDERVVWRLSEGLGRNAVTTVYQKRSAKGGWSAGRSRHLGDLFSGTRDDAPYDEFDREVLRAISLAFTSSLHSEDCLLHAAALEALVGHPRVIVGEGKAARPIAVVREHARLTLSPEGEELRVSVESGKETFTLSQATRALVGPKHLVRLDAETGVCRVARLSDSTIRVIDALAEMPTLLQRLDAIALLDAIARSGATVELALPPSLCEAHLDCDTGCRVALSPMGSIPLLGISLFVRPFGDDLAFAPGDGPAEIVRGVKGVLALGKRDFGAETAEAEAIARLLGAGALDSPSAWTWRTSTLEQSLAVVEAARALGERITVEWPKDAQAWTVRRISASALKVKIKRRVDWFGVGGEVNVDGVAVSLESLLEAVRHKRRFINLGRGVFAAIEDGLRAAVSSLDDLSFDAEDEELKIDNAAAGVLAGLSAEGELDVSGDAGWRKFLARLEEISHREPEIPAEFVGVLREYQIQGFRWLSRLSEWGAGACLADDMGLGKTVQALALLLQRAGKGPALVAAPTSVMSGWVSQARSFAPSLDVRLFHGATRAKALEKLGKGSLLVTSYDVLAMEIDAIEKIRFATLVVDEAQMIKNSATQRAKAIVRVNAEARIALSGTPVENHLGELWSIFRVLNPSLLGSLARFKERFAVPIEKQGDPSKRDTLAKLLRPFILRRTKAAVAPELPPRVETIRTVDL